MKLVHAVRALYAALAVSAGIGLGAWAQTADEGWKPYLVDKKGARKPFPESPAQMQDKEWLGVQYTDFTGFKPRLGVVLSEEKQITSREYQNEWTRLLSDLYGKPEQGTNPFNHIEDLVRQALGGTHRFAMVERTTATEDVLDEQDFGTSGRVDKKTAAAAGKMKGADYIVKATLIELNPEKEAKDIKAVAGGMGGNFLGIGSVGISGKVAFCRLNVRIVNAVTGVIEQDMTVDGTAKSSSVNVGGGMLGGVAGGLLGGAGGVGSKKEAAISDAMQACANKIAYHSALKFEDLPWQGAVASVNGSKLMINAGTNVGLKSGLVLKLLSKGDAVTDPDDSTSVLGYDTSEIGSVRIVTVQEKFSSCEIVDGGQGVKKGDLVRLEGRKSSATEGAMR